MVEDVLAKWFEMGFLCEWLDMCWLNGWRCDGQMVGDVMAKWLDM